MSVAPRALPALSDVRYVFSPLARLTTGVVVGIEVQPRLRDRAAEQAVAEVARGPGRAALDAAVAAGAVRWSAEVQLRIPLHVNLLADTVADGRDVLDELHRALTDVGQDPDEVLLEIGPPIGDPEPAAVVAGAARLRAHGYRLGVDEVGLHDHPLAVIAQIEPDLVKLHPEVTAGLLSDPGCDAVLDAVRRLCQHIGAELVVDGITDADRLRAVRRHGIGIGQGSLLAGPARRPPTQVVLPAAAGPAVVPRPRQPAEQPVPAATDGTDSSPSIATFAQPAVTVPDTSTGDAVRDAFRSGPEVTSVVLVDDAHRPVGLLDRNRFMIAVSGQFGHALHARRPVRDLADPPRVLPATADPRAVLDLMGVGGPGRVYDDITVVDRDGRCTGVARVGDLLRGIAELGYDRALALHPTTGLPGLPALPDLLDEQRTRGQGFALGVFACDVRPVVERGGFDAAVDGLRAVAAAVTAALGELPGSVAVHGVGDDIVVLTGLDLIADVESAVHRRLVDDRHAPQLRTTWLRCPPGHPVDPVQLARELSRRAAHLGHHG